MRNDPWATAIWLGRLRAARSRRRYSPLPPRARGPRGARRAREFLTATRRRDRRVRFRRGAGYKPAISAIRTQARDRVARDPELIEWPRSADRRLAQGLPRRHLRRRGQLRARRPAHLATPIASSSIAPLCLRRLGFDSASSRTTTERAACASDPGGLAEQLRFFHLVDPAITRKRAIEGDGDQVRRQAARRRDRAAGHRACRCTTSRPAPATSSPTASSATTASPGPLTPTSTSMPAGTSSGRSSSRSTLPEVLGRSWRGRRGRASTSPLAPTPIRISGSRGATGSCVGSGRRCGIRGTRARC